MLIDACAWLQEGPICIPGMIPGKPYYQVVSYLRVAHPKRTRNCHSLIFKNQLPVYELRILE